MVSKRIVTLLLVLVTSVSVGCTTFRSGRLAPISEWPPAGAVPKKSISLLLTGEMRDESGQRQSFSPRVLRTWRGHVLRAYQESGLFSQVDAAVENADLRAEAKVEKRPRDVIPFCALGLVYPCIQSAGLTLSTTVRNRDGDILGVFAHSETLTTWWEPVLILTMPFAYPGVVEGRALYDLSRATIVEARQHGAF